MNQELQPYDNFDNSVTEVVAAPSSGDRFSTAASLRMQVQRYWVALRKRWWIVALCVVFIGGPALVYAYIKKPSFESQAIMWLTSRLSLPGGAGFFSEEVSSYMNTQAELMKSPAVQQKAFQKVRDQFPEVAQSYTNPAPAVLPFELTIKTSPKNSVLNLQVSGPFAQPTRAFLDAVISEYLQLKQGAYKQTSSDTLTGITDQIKTVEKQTKALQDQLSAFETSNNISYLTEHGLSAGSHLSRLDEQLSDLRTENRMLDLLTPEQFASGASAENSPLTRNAIPGDQAARMAASNMQTVDAAYYQALQQAQLLKATRDQFAKDLRPNHSKMVKLSQQIEGYEQLLRTIKEEGGQRALAQMANRKKSIELQIQSLESQYSAWQTNAIEASAKLAQHERMKQDLQRSQALYDRLLGLVQTVDLSKNLDREPLSPLAPASPPKPVYSTIKIAAAGLFLAFGCGFGLLILLESFDDRFVSVTELSTHLPEEVIGQIPETSLSSSRNGSGGLVLRRPEEQHAFAESFRSLRSSIFFMFEESARPRVILLTSSVPMEGKSTVAAHLAASLAMTGSRVLLVDADLRRSSLHKIFGVDSKPGLREVLAQGLPAASAIIPVGLPQSLAAEYRDAGTAAKLFLLPSGEIAAGSSELLLGSRVDTFLREMAAQYDYVIIDSPPMLATDDAMGLASKVDGVFMVVRASYTYSRMVREALDRLRKRRVKVLGLVYNRASTSTDYYYRYSRDYRSAV